jgi:hypothetical protein
MFADTSFETVYSILDNPVHNFIDYHPNVLDGSWRPIFRSKAWFEPLSSNMHERHAGGFILKNRRSLGLIILLDLLWLK